MLLILPGYSLHNKEWAEEVVVHLKRNRRDKILIHQWRHYKDPDINFSPNHEIENIKEEISDDKKVDIIAKSVGVAIAMQLIPQISDKLGKVIFCGIASVSEDRKQAFKKVLDTLPIKDLLCIQNKKDKFVIYKDAQLFYHSVNPSVTVIEKPRSDHEYPYFEEFRNYIN